MTTTERIGIITDSVAVLPQHIRDELHIHVIPLNLEIDGRSYKDGIDLEPDDFYTLMRSSDRPPTTSQPSIGDFLEIYARASEGVDRTVYFALSSRLSRTCETARLAARQFEEETGRHVDVFDCLTAASSQGLIVSEAARVARAGRGYEAMLRRAQELRPKVVMYAVVETLEYLVRGGRVPRVAGWVGEALHVRPMIKLKDGLVSRAGFARSMKHGFQRMGSHVQREIDAVRAAFGQAELRVAVMHADNRAGGEAFLHVVNQRFGPTESYLTAMTPVMGAHTGPGLVGLGYFVEAPVERAKYYD
ncbi:MAG TPA: DegV family protein [Dehalococcoidia bacterium]|nr:DegV family protein [Dehalococcoidia bacterium]